MNIKELVPKSKFDDTNINKLLQLSDEEIKIVIYDLLEWLQDYNWPIASEVLKILVKRENLVFPYISGILNGNNIMWKYWIIELLIPTFSKEHKMELKEDILKIINDTDNDEDTESLKEVAIECYKKYYDCE